MRDIHWNLEWTGSMRPPPPSIGGSKKSHRVSWTERKKRKCYLKRAAWFSICSNDTWKSGNARRSLCFHRMRSFLFGWAVVLEVTSSADSWPFFLFLCMECALPLPTTRARRTLQMECTLEVLRSGNNCFGLLSTGRRNEIMQIFLFRSCSMNDNNCIIVSLANSINYCANLATCFVYSDAVSNVQCEQLNLCKLSAATQKKKKTYQIWISQQKLFCDTYHSRLHTQ